MDFKCFNIDPESRRSRVGSKMDYKELPYVSCVRIGKRPILPPLMTDERKAEMRYYRELAITLEKHQRLRKKKRISVDSGVIISNSDGSIGRKAAELDQSDLADVNDSPTAKSDVFTDMDDESPAARSGVVIDLSESSLIDGSMMLHSFHVRQRRDSYTLETPSPIMLEYMKANEKYDELLIDMMDSSDSNTVVDGEIPISIPIEEFCSDDITVQTNKLTLRDLEEKSEPINSSKSWNLNECSFGCNDIKEFVENAKRMKSFSLPSTSYTSPINRPELSASSCCLKNDYDKLVKNTSAIDPPKNHQALRDHELCETETISVPNEDHYHINDSPSNYIDLLDLNTSANMSLETEIYGRESSFSDCSSVSLSKFLVDMRVADNEESASLNNYLQMKEQLELKHRNELMKLLREQESENYLLDQVVRNSATSSPKTNYAYSKDVVLKKYSAENTPSPISKFSPQDSAQNSSKTLNCRRRICNEESEKLNNVVPYGIPVMMTATNLSNNENIQDFETRVRAATKINAAVRGYFVRRLFKTSRVQLLLQTINDCLITAISLQKESDLRPAELSLQNRVLQQSITAQNEIHEIYALPVEKQLEIIATDRELKNRSLLRKTRTPLPLSEATQKTIERRKSLSCSSETQKKVVRKRCKSASNVRFDSNAKRQHIPSTGKTKTKLSQNYTVPRSTRRSWR